MQNTSAGAVAIPVACSSALPVAPPCVCATPRITACNASWPIWIDCSTYYAQAAPVTCCLACSIATLADGTIGRADLRAVYELHAREAVGQTGTAAALRLAPWTAIGIDIASQLLYQTVPGDRYERNLSLIPEEQRCGIMRTLLRLPTNRFPKLVTGPVAALPPVILHEGLAVKIGSNSDTNHYRFARQTSRTITSPFEVWADRDAGGERVVRYLSRYGAPMNGVSGVVNHLVVANERTGICVTQYLRRDAQVTIDRKGQLLYAAWAAPSP